MTFVLKQTNSSRAKSRVNIHWRETQPITETLIQGMISTCYQDKDLTNFSQTYGQFLYILYTGVGNLIRHDSHAMSLLWFYYMRLGWAFGYCRCVRLCVCSVRPSVNPCLSAGNSPPVQAKNAKLRREVSKTSAKIFIVLWLFDLDRQDQIEIKSHNLPHWSLSMP